MAVAYWSLTTICILWFENADGLGRQQPLPFIFRKRHGIVFAQKWLRFVKQSLRLLNGRGRGRGRHSHRGKCFANSGYSRLRNKPNIVARKTLGSTKAPIMMIWLNYCGSENMEVCFRSGSAPPGCLKQEVCLHHLAPERGFIASEPLE